MIIGNVVPTFAPPFGSALGAVGPPSAESVLENGRDFRCNTKLCYGLGVHHQTMLALQITLNTYRSAARFSAIATDGFIGPQTQTAARLAATWLLKSGNVVGLERETLTLVAKGMAKEDIARYAPYLTKVFSAYALKNGLTQTTQPVSPSPPIMPGPPAIVPPRAIQQEPLSPVPFPPPPGSQPPMPDMFPTGPSTSAGGITVTPIGPDKPKKTPWGAIAAGVGVALAAGIGIALAVRD